ncbi:putative cell wall protein [Arachis duranensis]|uniref:Cell wall protein n=1 Tax=Arachis duranensis TaxID=130453 RepID=A0A6P4C267_ARADU|nr:putative cell wall protein [Arachis duranensis]
MAYKASSLLVTVLISSILLSIASQAVAARNSIPNNSSKNDKKEPQFMFRSDGVYIPGIGRVGLPGFQPQNPFLGGSGGGSAPAGGSYVPGGDDTLVPNPGFEVPTPGSGGAVPTPVFP